jgi:signal transduction histidine kinase
MSVTTKTQTTRTGTPAARARDGTGGRSDDHAAVHLPARWILGGVAALAVMVVAVMGIAWALLRPPWADLADLAVFLSMSGGLTLVAGLAGAMLGFGRFLRTMRGKLLLLPMLAAGLALVNVGFTARLMFISVHDLGLLAVLLSFSLGMSAFLALFLSSSLNGDVAGLISAVRRMGAGDLKARARVNGQDELREIADAFGAMAEQLERKIATQQEVEQARRHLVATVSHDLRTPLASMRAIVESINDGVVSEPETVRQYLRTLQRETEYLSRLIDDLFELSQLDAGILRLQLEPSSLKDLISDTLQSLTAQAMEKGVTVTGEVGSSVPEVAVDTRRLQRVLYNLVQNAVRHTPADGTVAITAEDAGQEVRVTVSDSGEGISPEEMPHLFESFHRADRSRSRAHGGAGLGLTIARGIVEAHGGRIWAESGPGAGSRFTFTLPKQRSAGPAMG